VGTGKHRRDGEAHREAHRRCGPKGGRPGSIRRPCLPVAAGRRGPGRGRAG
jgi:hypothetical protein